ncbi:hypothetical protein ANN_10034 [Periplaneta americana]|uniref:Uncharacterized protein n=1 Tax=Periplaneta americana TaxID=6978 RepID=A0ABQ8TQZ9_PERAM|nr:hypothetical protein ANN_10034 [Periplaneta americana]
MASERPDDIETTPGKKRTTGIYPTNENSIPDYVSAVFDNSSYLQESSACNHAMNEASSRSPETQQQPQPNLDILSQSSCSDTNSSSNPSSSIEETQLNSS